jgi:hypothetical protein
MRLADSIWIEESLANWLYKDTQNGQGSQATQNFDFQLFFVILYI